MLADDLLDFHQLARGGAGLLVQLHRDVFDGLGIVGDHDVLQRVDTTACALDLGRHQGNGLFIGGKLGEKMRFVSRLSIGAGTACAVKFCRPGKIASFSLYSPPVMSDAYAKGMYETRRRILAQ